MKHLTLLLLAAASLAVAGQFKHGIGRGDSLKAQVPTAPVVRIGRATLALEIRDAASPALNPQTGMPAAPAPITHLQAALDQVFSPSFSLLQSNAEASLRITITHHLPAESRIDQISQKARVPAAPNPDGSPQLDPQTGQALTIERTYLVEQWTALGELAVRVEVVDSSGSLLDTFTPQASVKANAVVSVDGQDRIDRTQLPTADQVRQKLLADLVAQFAARYCPPAMEIEIPLAVDEALRPGNKLAQTGDVAAAAQSWQTASLKKPEDEGDRHHNLGALAEAQGYRALRSNGGLAEAQAHFLQAAERYSAAASADPKEKYIARAADRVRRALALVETFKALEQKRQNALASKMVPSTSSGSVPTTTPAVVVEAPVAARYEVAPAAPDPLLQEAMVAALNDARADNPQEVAFRQLIRLRIRAAADASQPQFQQQLEAAGLVAFSLSALQSKRVVHQELRDWSALQPKLTVYRDTYLDFAADGRIISTERQALQSLASTLGLSPSDCAAVEAAKPAVE